MFLNKASVLSRNVKNIVFKPCTKFVSRIVAYKFETVSRIVLRRLEKFLKCFAKTTASSKLLNFFFIWINHFLEEKQKRYLACWLIVQKRLNNVSLDQRFSLLSDPFIWTQQPLPNEIKKKLKENNQDTLPIHSHTSPLRLLFMDF